MPQPISKAGSPRSRMAARKNSESPIVSLEIRRSYDSVNKPVYSDLALDE